VASLLRLGLRPASAAADLAGRGLVAGVDAALEWRYTEEAVRRVLESSLLERVAAELLESPALDRVIESRLLDKVIDRLLESDELWVLVDEVASSPAVTEAIGQQGIGFAGQVAGRVRERSQRADDTVERAARRVLRR
jgi:hypothetical protein